ncbi:MAG: hypothetical protein HY795_16430 [Desulfovibrio sp.]|nr:hypothetical protein [Desulfovibrio sp.]MBI4959162.1 hypothetical protein [Desulfovibrio sp.]
MKRGDRVFTVLIPSSRNDTLLPFVERMILPGSIVYADGFTS